ncbi:hypothetical protein [Thermus sp.]|uniref:hypothetical protein n=1 Tax=Thermus sp. TaxID=275 RepID=UPI00298EE32E|nr:hypothetical protein [Thermus sp.]MDW8358495.1 hypothetical protein [Thermus sp.]
MEAKVKVGDKTLTSSQVLELPEGTYEVVAERVALATGEVYAPTVEGSPAKVEYGKEARVSVVYALDPNTKPATLAIVISGLPEGAEGSVRVRGTGGDKVVKTTTWLTLPAGIYVIEASPVVYVGERYIPTPQAESVSLAPGSSVSKGVRYSEATGKLALSIQFQGAPAGSQGYLVVSGPSGNFIVNNSAVLTLSPGTYVITAYSVAVGGMPYNPNPPGGTVEVQVGGTATFTVVYSSRQSQ